MNKITKFARSPQGKQATAKAMDFAKDPATKRKLADVRRRFASKK